MNMAVDFASILKKNDEAAAEKDVVGGGSGPLDSDIYSAVVELAYLSTSTGGAAALNLRLKTDTGREIRQQLWMTSGKAKGCKNTYEKDGETFYLPGFLLADSLSLLTVGKEIGEVAAAAEMKTVKLYSFEAKEEVPTDVPVLLDLHGQEIYAAVIKQIVDKNAKGDDGKYAPTGETREENEIEKFFRARDKMTTAEIRAGAEEATFFNTWKEKWAGEVKNKAKGAAQAGTSGAPKSSNAKPTKSLFG